MIRPPRSRRITVALVGALTALTILSAFLPLASASSTTPQASVTGSAQWAYGAEWASHRTGSTANGSFSATAFYGWEALLSQVNTSATTFSVTVNYSASADLWVEYCSPNCHSAIVTANVTDRAHQEVTAVTNFTNDASVLVAGNAESAVGVSNTSALVSGWLTENTTVDVAGGLLGGAEAASTALAAHATSDSSGTFTPALGLIPTDLTPGMAWSSSSAYAGTGLWGVFVNYTHVKLTGAISHLSDNLTGSLSVPSTITLSGQSTGTQTLNGGVSTNPVNLSLEGPFAFVDGGVLVPVYTNLLQPNSQAWQSERTGVQAASLSYLDFRGHGVGHFGVLASADSYSSTSVNPQTTDATVFSAMPSTEADTGTALVQAEPQSSTQAAHGLNCIDNGVGCVGAPTTANPTLLSSPVGHGLILIGIIVVLSAVIIVLVVDRRRRIPSPTHPNAALYPPAVAPSPSTAPQPRGTPVPPAPPEPDAPDPLDNLW
ncbi:MAG: hypothetical protein WCA77_07020 [Thermoplasmata archaeon]